MLSQDEINALLSGDPVSGEADDSVQNGAAVPNDNLLTESEKDAIGEVANISMGTSATTLYSLVNHKVDITTPVVKLAVWQDVLDSYEKPCVFIEIKYTTGLDGHNILILKEHDVKVIADLMMGGDGSGVDDVELGELHLSAISEAMNQMMGSAATSLSQMLGNTIDISPPQANHVDLLEIKQGDEISPFLGGTFVKITFRMQIGDLVDSNILQLYPIDFAKSLVSTFMDGMSGGTSAPAPAAPAPAPAPAAPDPMQMNPMMGMPTAQPMGMPMMQPMGMPMMQPMGMPPEAMQNYNYQPAQGCRAVGSIPLPHRLVIVMDRSLQVRRTEEIVHGCPQQAHSVLAVQHIVSIEVTILVHCRLLHPGNGRHIVQHADGIGQVHLAVVIHIAVLVADRLHRLRLGGKRAHRKSGYQQRQCRQQHQKTSDSVFHLFPIL